MLGALLLLQANAASAGGAAAPQSLDQMPLGATAPPGPQLASIRARGHLRCAAVARPGIAAQSSAGRWAGIAVDICAASARAVLGAAARYEFRAYAADGQFQRIAAGDDDLAFLTGGEINAHGLTGNVTPGPAIFYASHVVVVPQDAPEQHLAGLAGQGVCFLIGSSIERNLEAYFDARRAAWLRHPYSEEGEMIDAYRAGRCHAIAGEATWLAARVAGPTAVPAASRILDDPLGVFPIIAATGTRDAAWAAVVAWTVITLVAAERVDSRWYAGGVRAMPASAAQLGLASDWQQAVVEAVGTYGDIYERNVGLRSPLRLPRGPNAAAAQGGLMLLPYVE